jgi:DNA-binding transcriptional regulator YdaS (Cro superfamily)
MGLLRAISFPTFVNEEGATLQDKEIHSNVLYMTIFCPYSPGAMTLEVTMAKPNIPVTQPQIEAIKKAVDIVGGQRPLAAALQIHVTMVSQWCCARRPIPAQYCWKIESLTRGEVSCETLRPDVFVPRPYANAPAAGGQR